MKKKSSAAVRKTMKKKSSAAVGTRGRWWTVVGLFGDHAPLKVRHTRAAYWVAARSAAEAEDIARGSKGQYFDVAGVIEGKVKLVD